MNWITKFIKPKIKSLFEKKSSKSEENLWTTCVCKNLVYKEDLLSNFKCCQKCGAHHKLDCKERFDFFFDNKEYEIIKTPLPKDDPLKFQDNKKYVDRLKSARKITKQDDAVLIAKGKVKNIDVVVGAQDFRFIGGSFGAASGEAFIAGIQQSIENKILYFTFNTYILNGTIRYFNHVQNNVFFIKENHKLSQSMINSLINYEYLVSYVEVDKI